MATSDTRYPAIVFAIVAFALALRVTWAALVPVIPMSDGEVYNALARTLVQHGVYGWNATTPSAYWPPGTSGIYAVLYLTFGQGFTPIVILNIILSSGIVGLTIWFGSIVFDKATGIFAGLLMAIWPSEVFFVTMLASEIPFTFLVLLGCIAWFSLRLSNSVRAIAGGLAFAAAAYLRPIAILLPIVIWFSALPDWKKIREGIPVMLVAMAVMVLAVAPWSVRNTKNFGHFVSMTTSDGVNLWMGNNANSDGYYMPQPATIRGLGEYDQNKILMEDALLYITEHPGTFVLRFITKAGLLHARETIAITWNMEGIKRRLGENALFPLKLISQSFWTCILLLALGGIAILALRRGIVQTLASPAVLIWLYFTAVYSIFVVADRYHFPSHPFISMLAAVAILSARRHIPTRRRKAT